MTLDTYTKSLLHFDGSNNSTTFTDESGKTWTPAGNAKLVTSAYKFAPSSGYFDGVGDYISTPNHADFDLDSVDFTIDFWLKCTELSAGELQEVVGKLNSWFIFLSYDGSGKAYVGMVFPTGGSEYLTDIGSIDVDTWTHIAVSVDVSAMELYAFIDGYLVGDMYYEFTDNTETLNIGRGVNTFIDDSLVNYEGYIDEFRLSKGVCRWTADFTPPAKPYGADFKPRVIIIGG